MGEILAIIGIVSGLITLAMLVAGVIVNLTRANVLKATVTALRDDITDRDKRIDERDDRIKDLEDIVDRQQIAMSRQGEEIRVLRDMVTGREEIVALTQTMERVITLIEKHDEAAERRHHDAMSMDEQVLEQVQSGRQSMLALHAKWQENGLP
jgi:hypothetical protein